MQVEPDYNGLRNGHYNGQWGYLNDATQMSCESDLLPEKIYSMVSKLVDEDGSDVDIKQSATPFQQKRSGPTGFYGGTPAWSDSPLQNNNNDSLRLCALSPISDNTKDLVFPGLDQLDLSHNVLDFSFLAGLDDFSKNGSKTLGENLDSGFASPADKLGGSSINGIPSHDDVASLAWDLGQLSGSLDPDANQNYVNLFSQNSDLLDQIVRGDSGIDSILNDSGLLQLDLLQSNEPRAAQNHHSSLVPEAQNEEIRRNMLPLPNVGLLPASTTSSVDSFSPFRPPPDLPYVNVNGPLGFNNNNEYRSFPNVGEVARNGYNMHVASPDVPIMFGNGTDTGSEWRGPKGANPFGNGIMPFAAGPPPGVDLTRPGSLPRFSPTGPFRSPPPFLPPLSARLPLYPPTMDPAELYPLPCFPRHPLFPFQQQFYSLRQLRRSPNPTRDELSARLDQCYEQFRQLEKERKKTEAELARHNPGKKLSSANSITVPRLPPSPTRVDRLVVDQLREHARVVTLVSKMERLRGKPMGSDVHSTLSVWDDAIRRVQALRQEEVRCRSRMPLDPMENRVHLEDKALANSIHELSVASRKARTAMWACLMVTLHSPQPAAAAAAAATPTTTTATTTITPAVVVAPTSTTTTTTTTSN